MTPMEAWLTIPLREYEGHMAEVGQTGLLTRILGLALERHRPRSVLVAGCAGGSGFEQIAATGARRIVGIDLHPDYIESCRQRYAALGGRLQLAVADLQALDLASDPVDLVYAALIFEYVDLARALAALARSTHAGGVLVAILQQPYAGGAAVSPSTFPGLRALGPLLRTIEPLEFRRTAAAAGWVSVEQDRLTDPQGKPFAVETLRNQT